MADLQTTFKKLYVAQDFINVNRSKLSPEDEEAIYTSLMRQIPINITKKTNKTEYPKKTTDTSDSTTIEASLFNSTTKYLSNVMLLNGKSSYKSENKKDKTEEGTESTKEKETECKKTKTTFYELEKDIKFMVAVKGKSIVTPGGFWNSDLDGSNPKDDDNKTLIKTAIRCFKAQTQIDLSSCQKWIKFSETHYFIKEENIELVSVIFVPIFNPNEEINVYHKNGQLTFSWLSLNGLLEYNEEDVGTFEVSLFGELFKILLCSMFGRKILSAIKLKMDSINREDKEIDGEPDAKRSRIVQTNRDVLLAFQFFDKGATSFIKSKDLSSILFFLNSGLSRRMVQDYIAQLESKESSGFVPYSQIAKN